MSMFKSKATHFKLKSMSSNPKPSPKGKLGHFLKLQVKSLLKSPSSCAKFVSTSVKSKLKVRINYLVQIKRLHIKAVKTKVLTTLSLLDKTGQSNEG